MTLWDMYFTTVIVLLGMYAVVRLSIWYDHRLPKEGENEEPGAGIDATGLSRRLGEVKRNYTGGLRENPSAFKKPLLVEQKREEMSRMAFFHKPPEPEQPEKEEGLTLILV